MFRFLHGIFYSFFLVNSVYSTIYSMVPFIEDIGIAKFQTKCPVGFFRCNSSFECVAQRYNCDGSVHCNDGSDEWNCSDGVNTMFWDHLFRKQPYARSDDIPVGSCVWNDFKDTCLCRGSEILCRFQDLKELPRNLPESGMEMLDLTGNHFPVLTRDFFKDLRQVEILVLKFCNIAKIEPFTFQQFSVIFVETLYLDENKITTLPENLFPPHNGLKILILSGNKIKTLQSYNFHHLNYLKELDLRNNEIETFTAEVFQPLKSLEALFLNNNKIKGITKNMMPTLPLLKTLSLAHNRIEIMEKGSLNLPQLEHLFFSGNKLTIIENKTFCGLPKLLGLNLDNNKINKFELEAFACVENLTSLLLTENLFQTLDNRVLANLTKLNYIYFSWFHLCRAALHVRVCEPKGDGISSTRHLLDNVILRTCVWIMSAVGIFGNLIVLLGRFFNRNRASHVEHSLYLRHLAASDLIMGIYLAAIAIADIQFRGEYIIHEESWRHSATCATCGFLSTLSCQSSTLLLTLVTWDRLISVTQPLQPRTTGKSMIILRLIALWAASFFAAAAPFSSTAYFGNYFYGSNGVCLSLHIHDPYAKGWEYSAGLFVVVNTLALIFIIIAYFKMIKAIRGSGESIRSTHRGRENVVAKRFAIIVATDCACWLPIILVKLAALGGFKISSSLYAWLAVLVLPVNSALNPVLYTLTTATFKQQLKKFFYTLPCGASPESRSQIALDSALSISLGHFSTNSSRRRLLHRRISYV